MKKIYALCALTIFSLFFCKEGGLLYAQDAVGEENAAAEQVQDKQKDGQNETKLDSAGDGTEHVLPEDDSPKVKPSIGRLVFTFGAAGILNTDKNSAPSPVLFSVGAGAQFPVYANRSMILSIAPHGHFFACFYLWDKTGKTAFPAEIEHRTAYVPSIMFDSPILFHFPVKNSIFTAGLGPSFLIRFGARAINVPSSEDADIRLMNQWFWQNGRFFYPALHFSWDYVFPGGTAVGIGIRSYLSAGALLDKRGLDRSMIILSARLIPPRRK